MKTSLRAFTLLALLACALAAMAQLTPGPDLAKLSNLTFGWVSMSGVDPTLEMLTSFAPTSMALRDAGYSRGGEYVTGTMTFSDLEIDSNFHSAMTALGPGILRICEYKYDSNLANIVGLPGMPARTDGRAIEVSYAQHVGNATVGISMVPLDDSAVTMVAAGQNMVESESDSDWGGRVGAVVRLPRSVKLGFDYSYQRDNGVVRMNPLLTGAPEWVEQEGQFITRCGTIGASAPLGKQTTVYCAYQNILATGEGLGRRNADLVWFGAQHSLSDKLAIRANYLDGGQNYSVQWRSPVGIVNLAYTHNALKNAEDILGNGDAAFAALAVAF